MKRLKFLAGVLAIAVVLGAMSIPMAAAQVLDNVWFKVKIQTKGHSVDVATGAYATLNLPITAYIQLHWDSVNKWYNLDVWVNGTKAPVALVRPLPPFPPAAGTENFFNFAHFTLFVRAGPEWYVETLHIPLITHKTDAHGSLHATWKGTGEAVGGSRDVPQTKLYCGSFNISGTNIDPGKLPFTP
jgi:hypothetical protein